MKRKREITLDDLATPSVFLPEWFAVSPSMVSTINSCEYEAFFKYVLSIKAKQNNIALVRGSIVHGIMQVALMAGIRPTPESIHDHILSHLQQEVKGLRRDLHIDNEEDPWDVLKEAYKIPSKKPTKADIEMGNEKPDAFDLDALIKQCENAVDILLDFVAARQYTPIINPVDNMSLIEMDIKHPMVSSQGEILDTTHDRPTDIRSIIDFVALDPSTGMVTIIDWKTGLKKSSEGAEITPIDSNQAVIAYVKALLHIMPRNVWPDEFKEATVNVALVRAVVKNNGAKSMDEPEYFEKVVTQDEIDEVVNSYASAAKRLKSVDLRREVTWNCDKCIYARLCLKKDIKDYYVYEYADDTISSEDAE